jgi:hypothetical protein
MKIKEKLKGYFDYKNMSHEFRPYVMFVNADNYKTSSINTDNLGFRKTINSDGVSVNLNEVKSKYQNCNILMGGSAAFGMGNSSDSKTISSFLSQSNIFCQNLGVRAATGQQELILYIQFKRFFNNVKNIILFSGINDISIAAQKSSFFYPDFGGVFSEDLRLNIFWQQYIGFGKDKWEFKKNNFFNMIDLISKKFSLVKFFLYGLFSLIPSSKITKKTKKLNNLNFDEKLNYVKKIVSNDLDTWALISKQSKINIIYVLQPNACWAKKKLSEYEQKILDEEKNHLGEEFYKNYSDINVYRNQKKFLESQCNEKGIKFIDSNEWLANLNKSDEIFNDSSHLTDYGNKIISDNIQKFLV